MNPGIQDLTPVKNCDRIVQHLLEILDRGIEVPAETLFFASSTYGIEPEGLGAILGDEGFEDRQLLLDLMLFPDQAARFEVEQIIDGDFLTMGQQDLVIAALLRMVETIRFFSARFQPFQIRAEESSLAAFVTKFYLTRGIDAALHSCLDQHLSEQDRFGAQIILRRRENFFPADSLSLLCRLIEFGPREPGCFLELFQVALEILAGRQEGMSPEQCFLTKRRELMDRLRSIREFEKKQEQYGMEYLLMQRYQVPIESAEVVMGNLRSVMQITDLLNLRPVGAGVFLERDLGTYSSERDLDQLFRALS